MITREVTYLEDKTVAQRMGAFADKVLAETRHGWPLGYYMGSIAAAEAKNTVRILVDAHMHPPYRKEGESADDYDQRRTGVTEDVHRQLDEVEKQFMSIDLGDNPDPSIVLERFIRFGGQSARAIREEAVSVMAP